VRIDQAGRHDLAGRVDHFGSRDVQAAADRVEHAVPDVHVPAGNIARRIHRQDVTAADQEVSVWH
jgi:hypothetical protein